LGEWLPLLEAALPLELRALPSSKLLLQYKHLKRMMIIGETANVASNVGNLFRVRQQSSCGGHPPWVAHPPIRLTLLALGFDSTDFFSQLPCVRAHRGLVADL
jgi:hypothetical protein